MSLLEAVIGLAAPHACAICSNEGSLLCGMCLEAEVLPAPSRCYRCHKATIDSKVCTSCRKKVPLSHVWVRTLYTDTTSKVLLRFKFERAQAAFKPVGAALAQMLPVLPSETILIGVPTATSRIRQRGYDHTRLIVRQLASETGLLYLTPVIRSGQAHQFGATRTQRLRQLSKAFSVVAPTQVSGKKILIVDDVLTTGATLETLAKVLKNAGAKQVDAVVFAQKM